MVTTVTPQQAQELIAAEGLDIVDVREPGEWVTGHLPGARLVPLQQFKADPKTALPRDGVLFVCASGGRSMTAAKVAEAQGLAKIYNLAGGTRGWATAGLPIAKD